MENTSSDKNLTVATLRLGKIEFKLAIPTEQIPRKDINRLTTITLPLEQPISLGGRDCPFVVFPIRLKEDLTIEQTADAFPCMSKEEAQTVAASISRKNIGTPVVTLASWDGHFTLATLSNEEYFRDELVLFPFHQPKVVDGEVCGYALRIYRHFSDKPREIIWEKILNTTDPNVAENLHKKKHLELVKEKSNEKAKLEAATQSSAELVDAQLKVLSKAYPKTVSYLRNPAPKNIEAAFSAYTEEALAASKNLSLIGSLTESEFKEVARLLRNAARRKNPPVNDVEFELVVGWRLRGYDKMTPEQRFQALSGLGLKPASQESIRKICERLGLPTVRKRGAPRKSPSK